jgi:RecJ-like exonuclease
MVLPARDAAELIRAYRNDTIEIVSHMDADGVCAAAILSIALERMNIEHYVKFVHMLYRDVMDQLEAADLVIFTDLGSSQLQNVKGRFKGHDAIIADHHYPEGVDGWPELIHLNAHLYGLDGVQEISGAGMAYAIARELDPRNADLSALAIVGAIGDVQNAWGKLLGHNRNIMRDAINAGVLTCKTDLLLYGRHSRPIFKALETFTDPPIPGISNSTAGCVTLLKDLGIRLKDERGWRRPIDLTDEEKRKLATELISRALMHVPKELVAYVPGLIIGETHTLLKESERSMLRDADEFATCINSTARHEQPLIGLEVVKGDRGVYYRAMLNLIKYYRRSIAEGMEFIQHEKLMKAPRGYLQYFDATGVIKETFVGTLASMTLGHMSCDPYKPVAGIVRSGGVARISARCSKLLFLKGLNMAQAIRKAAKAVDGEGGGHAVACGAQVEEDKLPEFLTVFEDYLIEEFTKTRTSSP